MFEHSQKAIKISFILALLVLQTINCNLKNIFGEEEENYTKEDLFWAIEIWDRDDIKKIINKNPTLVNASDSAGFAPLHMVCERCPSDSDEVEIVKLFIEKGANIEAKIRSNFHAKHMRGWTPLHCAVYCSYEVTKLLLLSGANIEERDDNGFTPLIWSVFPIIMGVPVGGGPTFIEYDIRSWADATIVGLLVENGAEINARNNAGMTATGFAKTKNPEAYKFLIAHGGVE